MWPTGQSSPQRLSASRFHRHASRHWRSPDTSWRSGQSEAWGRASQSVDIKLISMSEAGEITVPPGHPKIDVLYVGHPGISDRYSTTADFHRVVFEHKFSEAVRLLMALGATTIEVHHVAGWSSEFMGSMTLALPGGIVGAGARTETGGAESLLLRANLGADGREDPFIPSDLVWYPNEHLWQVVAQGRIEQQLKRCQLAVSLSGRLWRECRTACGSRREREGKGGDEPWGNLDGSCDHRLRIDAVFGDGDRELVRSSGTESDPE